VSSKSIACLHARGLRQKIGHCGGGPICLRWNWIAERELPTQIEIPGAKLQSLVAVRRNRLGLLERI
jgi:hypothetical protein